MLSCLRWSISGFVALFILAACGGGGGGSDEPAEIFDVGTGFDDSTTSIAAAIDGSGDIYVGGFFTSYRGVASPRLIRLNHDATIDTGFVIGSGFDAGVAAIAPATDGSGDVYVAGHFTSYQGSSSNGIVRLNSDGSIDAGFDVNSGFNDSVRSVAVAADGSGDVYAGGFFTGYNGTGYNRIIRLDSTGSIDAGFDDGSGFNGVVALVVPAIDGSEDVYAAGSFTEYRMNPRNRIARANSNGSNDGGLVVGSGFNATIEGVAPAGDGSGDIYIAGQFTDYNGVNSNRITRLDSDGAVDPGFDYGSGFNGVVFGIALARDGSGDIYVGGGYTEYKGAARNRLVRLNGDGSPDNSFDIGTGFNDSVEQIAPAADGSRDIYVAGDFTVYDGSAVPGLIRLNSSGQRN